MGYRIEGVDPAPFRPLFGASDSELESRGAIRMKAEENPGFPCRVRLDDAAVGDAVLLVNHVSLDVRNPYRASHAIFVTEGAEERALYEDEVPPALDRRILSLRAFDQTDMMVDAALARPGDADSAIRALLANPRVASIHAHNAIRGCFAARIERR